MWLGARKVGGFGGAVNGWTVGCEVFLGHGRGALRRDVNVAACYSNRGVEGRAWECGLDVWKGVDGQGVESKGKCCCICVSLT